MLQPRFAQRARILAPRRAEANRAAFAGLRAHELPDRVKDHPELAVVLLLHLLELAGELGVR